MIARIIPLLYFSAALLTGALAWPSPAGAPPSDACLDLKRSIVREETWTRDSDKRDRLYVFITPSGEAITVPSNRVRWGDTKRWCRDGLHLPHDRPAFPLPSIKPRWGGKP
jgi:hypothetical protein